MSCAACSESWREVWVAGRKRFEQLASGRAAVARRRSARRASPPRCSSNTAGGVGAPGLTHTAAMRTNSSTSAVSEITPVRSAASTPAATPACAAPHVSWPCASFAMAALFTNSVGGFTGRLGRTMATNGVCPALGVASAVAHAVPTGPSREPEHRVHVRGVGAASPANPSPICIVGHAIRRP